MQIKKYSEGITPPECLTESEIVLLAGFYDLSYKAFCFSLGKLLVSGNCPKLVVRAPFLQDSLYVVLDRLIVKMQLIDIAETFPQCRDQLHPRVGWGV